MRLINIVFFIFFVFSVRLNAEQVVLRAHQAQTLDYLLKHPEQKGILLYHSLGSGKTFLALSYAEAFQDKPVLVIVPRFLKSNWIIQMDKFHVKNRSRYELLSFEEAGAVLQRDLSNTIIIIDEVHKLIDKIRFGKQTDSVLYADVYKKMLQADKVIALTGTPIYNKASDISYLANLVSRREDYPLNEEVFRSEYMTVKPWTSLMRGYAVESKLTYMFVPLFVTLTSIFCLSVSVPVVAVGMSAVAPAILPKLAEWYPIERVSFREFAPEKFQQFSTQYISFHETKEDDLAFFPKKIVHEKKVPYTSDQLHFYLDYIDQVLGFEGLKRLLKDTDSTVTESQFKLNGHKVLQDLALNPVNGREIGNFSFLRADGSFSESAKYMQVLGAMHQTQGKIAVYSSYFHNGLLEFAQFLDRHGFKDQYVILSPDESIEAQIKNLTLYNEGKKRILLIHPEITEGISLIATSQLHILEPVVNIALQDQIIGRAVRFKSHEALLPEQRKVDIFLWQSDIDYSFFPLLPNQPDYIRREHWQKTYPEINPNNWTNGLAIVDKKHFWKEQAPDARVKSMQDSVYADMTSFKDLAQRFSVETKN